MEEVEITRMKQIKLFYYNDIPDCEVEKSVNAWIADNNINVVDVKFNSDHEYIEIMVIYEEVETV